VIGARSLHEITCGSNCASSSFSSSNASPSRFFVLQFHLPV